MCVKTELHVCQVLHVKIDVHVYQENTTCLLSVTCQDRCKCVSRHVCQVSHVRTDMSVKCKEGVQGTPNMTIKTKKLSNIRSYLALLCKAKIPYLTPFYLNRQFLLHFPWSSVTCQDRCTLRQNYLFLKYVIQGVPIKIVH